MRFITLFVTGAVLLIGASPGQLQAQRERVDTAFTFDPGGSVILGIVSGEIRVVAGSGNEIRISASIERGRLETSFARNRVSVEARSVNNRMGDARFELTVPVGTRVRATAVSGDIMIRGTQDEVEVGTVSGDVSVSETGKMLKVGTVSGSLDLTRIAGRQEVSTVSGSARVVDVSGELTLSAVSGRLTVRDARVTTLRASSVSGEISYDGLFARDGSYQFNSHSGSIEFGVPANAGADLDVQTFSGRISSDFPLTLRPGETVGRRNRRMQFTIGAGGARISAESFSGHVTIRRASPRGTEE